ncbi:MULTISPECIES: TonB-dependent receptor domain-containing protein [Maribacter]|uniref:TonB-dependent receptor n=1 Tax=Maribacter flavus TaxID=1658664 RepID=A0ABU7IJJ8_9FLAO|nr:MULTISPECIES: TonB-dependent receptor [Maribacter]MDC6405714.1 TonB-dependent receptor [Maribacter sp. PR66]MEE1973034.1 TonB-dependent receptor [Maribacter flavus]
MRIFIAAFLFFITFSTNSFGQLSGKFVDASNNYPLEYATAALFDQENGTLITGVITDIDGLFLIDDIKKGTYYLEASFIGYNSQTVRDIIIDSKNEEIDLGTLALTIGENQLEEVVVEGEMATVINKIDRQVFDAKQFQNSQGGTATDVLRNVPAVSVNGLGEISVRGSTGFVVLLNGKPVQGSASTLLNQLPANAIERVELITAPSARYDPEGKAGILNILTKKGAADGSFAQFNLKGGFPSIERYGNAEAHQRYGIDGTYNIRKGNWNISLGANYQRNDLGGRREGDVFTIIQDTLTRFPSSGERSFDELNYSGRFTVDFTPDSLNTFSLGFYAGKRSKDRTADILYFDNHAITPADGGERLYTLQYFNENLRIRRGDFVLGSIDYAHTFGDGSKLSTSFLHEYTLLGGPTTNQNLGFPNTNIVLQDEFNTNDNPLNGIRFQADYVWKPWSIGQLETGYQYRYLDHTGDFVYERLNNTTGIFELIPEFSSEVDLRRTLHSGYAQLSGSKGKWDYTAGTRVEAMQRDFDLRDKTNTIDTTYVYNYVKLFPSASLQYTFADITKLKAAYSKRVERTTTFKMNPFPEREHSETLEQGDPTLRPEFIDLFEVGISKNLHQGNSVFATAYYRNTENLVNRVNTVFNDTILNRIYSNVGKAKAFGVELGAELKPLKNWKNFIGANLYKYRIDGNFDNRTVETEAFIYSINANSTIDFSDTASAQFTLNYLSAQNTAQGEDSRFYSPNLTLRKTFFDDRLTATLQWQNIDLGLLDSNEQRITTFRDGEFFTTTNYVYEVDMVILNLTYTFNRNTDKSRFIDSEFGKKEF